MHTDNRHVGAADMCESEGWGMQATCLCSMGHGNSQHVPPLETECWDGWREEDAGEGVNKLRLTWEGKGTEITWREGIADTRRLPIHLGNLQPGRLLAGLLSDVWSWKNKIRKTAATFPLKWGGWRVFFGSVLTHSQLVFGSCLVDQNQ